MDFVKKHLNNNHLVSKKEKELKKVKPNPNIKMYITTLRKNFFDKIKDYKKKETVNKYINQITTLFNKSSIIFLNLDIILV